MATTLSLSTKRKESMEDITGMVEEALAKAPAETVAVHLQVLHTSCALHINEGHDPQLREDILDSLARLVPAGGWRHDRLDGNADAHIKTSLLGTTLTIGVEEKQLVLGTWQRILCCEFDGPRTRTIRGTYLS